MHTSQPTVHAQASNPDSAVPGAETASLERQFLFIINPQSGSRQDAGLEEAIRAVFDRHHLTPSIRIERTLHTMHARDLAADFARVHGSRGVVIACGGDGTAHEAANGLAGTATALGILPIGTSNDFAKTVYPSLTLSQLLERMPFPRIAPVDLIAVNDSYCLNIMSLGFDTKVQRTMLDLKRRFRWLIRLSYPLAILISLFGNRRFVMDCEFDAAPDQPGGLASTMTGRVQFILSAFCNGRYYGNGYFPAPGASVTDSLIDICLIDPLTLPQILGLIPRYKKGTHISHPAVHQYRTASGHIQALPGQELLGNYDGESFHANRIDFKVLPGCLQFAFY